MSLRCSNCEASLPAGAKYCHECGQDQREKIVPFKTLVGDILRDLFAFDTKFFRSVPALITKPGFLTNEFVAGRRIRYIPAVRMYIFISLVAFLIFSINAGTPVVQDGRLMDIDEGGMTVSGMEGSYAAIDSMGVDAWKKQRIEEGGIWESAVSKFILASYQGRMPLLLERFRRQVPLSLFLVIPVLALLLKLLFRRRFYVEHLVFMFHISAFMLLAMALMHLVGVVALDRSLSAIGGLIAMAYLFLAMRRVYHKQWIRTLLSTLLIGACCLLLFAGTMLLTMYYVLETI